MLWASLRLGWGNTGFVAALVMLPFVSLANPNVQTEHSRATIAAVQVDAVTLAQAPVAERSAD